MQVSFVHPSFILRLFYHSSLILPIVSLVSKPTSFRLTVFLSSRLIPIFASLTATKTPMNKKCSNLFINDVQDPALFFKILMGGEDCHLHISAISKGPFSLQFKLLSIAYSTPRNSAKPRNLPMAE